MCPGDPLGNHRQRPIAVSLVFEPVLAHEDGMGVPAPLPHQGRAGLQRSAGVEQASAFLELSRQNLQAALQGGGRAAMGALLQLVGEPPNDQIATETQRRADVMQSPPRTPQLLCRLIDQPGDFAIKLGRCQTSSQSFRPSFAPRPEDGSPDCWRAETSSTGVFIGWPVRRCGRPGRALLWPRPE